MANPSSELVEGRSALARALWAAKQDRARARSLAKDARTALAGAGAAGAEKLAEVNAWLAKH